MVVQSVAEHERMQETLALLKMPAQSQQAVSLGKTVSSADAFSQLRAARVIMTLAVVLSEPALAGLLILMIFTHAAYFACLRLGLLSLIKI